MSTNAILLSSRARELAASLRELAGSVAPATWQALRPLANAAEAMAEDLERVEDFESEVLYAAHEETCHVRPAEPQAG